MPSHDSDPFVPDGATTIWRCLDDWKFDDMFEPFAEHEVWNPPKPGQKTMYCQPPGRLWFSYPASFEDDKEGTLPDIGNNPAEYIERVIAFKNLSGEDAERLRAQYLTSDSQKIRDGIVFMAALCGVSCWHANDVVGPSMWDFVTTRNGVAIRSTCNLVEEALTTAHQSPRQAMPSICAVGYVDHSRYFLPYDGFRGVLALVQSDWAYEKEVRYVAKSPGLAAIPMRISRTAAPDLSDLREMMRPFTRDEINAGLDRVVDDARKALIDVEASGSEGFRLPVDLRGLMTEVVLKPGSEAGYEKVVREKLDRFGCGNVPVRTA